MLRPKKTKYKKYRKGRIPSQRKKSAVRSYDLVFGNYGLRAVEGGRLTARQLEASRRSLRRKLHRKGKLWIRVFPDIPVTAKPTEVRMGKGKGSVEYWTVALKPGQIIFELQGVSKDLAFIALKSASKKMSVATRFVQRNTIL